MSEQQYSHTLYAICTTLADQCTDQWECPVATHHCPLKKTCATVVAEDWYSYLKKTFSLTSPIEATSYIAKFLNPNKECTSVRTYPSCPTRGELLEDIQSGSCQVSEVQLTACVPYRTYKVIQTLEES